jgi:hypothetical protein
MSLKAISCSVSDDYGDNILSSMVSFDTGFVNKHFLVSEFENPYQHEVELTTADGEKKPENVEVIGLVQLAKAIDKKDCLPDIGLLDYKDEFIDVHDVTLQELYKEVLKVNNLL